MQISDSCNYQYLVWKEKILNDQVSFASALRYSRLMQVNLKSSNLWRVPEFVTEPRVILCITEIDLSYNSIFFLSDSMFMKFGQIRSLNISCNSILKIPASIAAMKSLHTLDVSNNNLLSLPLSMRECILLTTFKLAGNNMSTFPEVLLKMGNLIELDIGYNRIKTLPLEIDALCNLLVFVCRSNLMTALPPTMPKLVQLKVLDIRHNLIDNFSMEILRMPCISVLTLWGNPCPYVTIIENGVSEELPDEWRSALPQLLAAGNPPKKTPDAKNREKKSFCKSCFFKRSAKIAVEEANHTTPKFSAAEAINIMQQHTEVSTSVVPENQNVHAAAVADALLANP
jgi:hypothetical protein